MPVDSNSVLRTFAAMNFDLQLKEEKVKPHQVTALHLIVALAFVGVGALLALMYTYTRFWTIPLVVIGLGILLVTMVRNRWIVQTNINRSFRIAEFILLAVLAIYSAIHRWTPPAVMLGVISLAVLFALFWENGKGVLVIQIDDSGVRLPPGKTKRNISWPEIDQVLLKFGTLTINCADSRLYQWSVNKADFDMMVFEKFCNAQVEQGKAQRDANDW